MRPSKPRGAVAASARGPNIGTAMRPWGPSRRADEVGQPARRREWQRLIEGGFGWGGAGGGGRVGPRPDFFRFAPAPGGVPPVLGSRPHFFRLAAGYAGVKELCRLERHFFRGDLWSGAERKKIPPAAEPPSRRRCR